MAAICLGLNVLTGFYACCLWKNTQCEKIETFENVVV